MNHQCLATLRARQVLNDLRHHRPQVAIVWLGGPNTITAILNTQVLLELEFLVDCEEHVELGSASRSNSPFRLPAHRRRSRVVCGQISLQTAM